MKVLTPLFSCLLALVLITPVNTYAVTKIAHNFLTNSLDEGDMGYELSFLILSLEKTRDQYGDFVLEPIRNDMSYARRVKILQTNRYKNFVSALPYQASLNSDDKLVYANFPVFRGVFGYRTCFTSKSNLSELQKVESKEEMFAFTHGQLQGWVDVDILRHNGFSVTSSPSYSSLFSMVANQRFSLFCRGANEVLAEYKYHQHKEGFAYDRSIALYYPLPHFYYAHMSDKALMERIEKGLIKAFQDGSADQLLNKYFKQSIEFVALDQRKIFRYENPFLQNINRDYEKFVFQVTP